MSKHPSRDSLHNPAVKEVLSEVLVGIAKILALALAMDLVYTYLQRL
tara:strand:- start:2705 stop:2845 length:141 start_codon:yes stop_codon:yes gene_type:complete